MATFIAEILEIHVGGILIGWVMYRQSSVKILPSKNISSNNTYHILTLFSYITHDNPDKCKIEQKSIKINITPNRHFAFVYLLGITRL